MENTNNKEEYILIVIEGKDITNEKLRLSKEKLRKEKKYNKILTGFNFCCIGYIWYLTYLVYNK